MSLKINNNQTASAESYTPPFQSTNFVTGDTTSEPDAAVTAKIREANHYTPNFFNLFDSKRANAKLYPSSFENSPTTGAYEEIDFRGQPLNLHYFEKGDPAKPVLFCVHGFQSNAYQFSKVFNDLAKDYHVIAIDLPGCGYSGFTQDHNYDFEKTLPDILDAFTKKKELTNITLLCSSMAYDMCAPWAAREDNPISQIAIFDGITPLGHSNLVSALAEAVGKMKISPPGSQSDSTEKFAVRYTLSNTHRKHTFGKEDVDQFFNPIASKTPGAQERKKVRAVYSKNVAKLISDPEVKERYEAYNQKIKAKVLIVQSEWDKLVPSGEAALWLLDTIPNSRLLIIPKKEVPTAGHTLMSDTPQLATQIVDDFMTETFPTCESEEACKDVYWNYRSRDESYEPTER